MLAAAACAMVIQDRDLAALSGAAPAVAQVPLQKVLTPCFAVLLPAFKPANTPNLVILD